MKTKLSPKDRGLIKGAIRRVFSRSELRREVMNASRIDWFDVARPRVTKWGRCAECLKAEPLYKMHCDHIQPLIPLDKKLEDMSWDEVVERTWCNVKNLQSVCQPCHKAKSKAENAVRRKLAKERK